MTELGKPGEPPRCKKKKSGKKQTTLNKSPINTEKKGPTGKQATGGRMGGVR